MRGVEPFRSHDPGLVMQFAIDALTPAGGVITWKPGTQIEYSSCVPRLPKDLRGPLVINWSGSEIRLAPGAPRAFDFDHDGPGDEGRWFQNLHLRGGSVDAGLLGGRQHVLLGTFIEGRYETGQRVNLRDISIQNVRVVNALVSDDKSSEDHRIVVALILYQPENDEPVQVVADGITIRNVHMEGGNAGVIVAGTAMPSSTASPRRPNILIDRVTIESSSHDTGADALPHPINGTSFQVGGWGRGESVRIRHVFGRGSGDNCVEINAMQDAVVSDATCVNPRHNAFTVTNYQPARDVTTQSYLCERCVVRHTEPWPVDNAYQAGWAIYSGSNASFPKGDPANRLGSVVVRDSLYEATGGSFNAAINADRVSIGQLVLENVTFSTSGEVVDGETPTWSNVLRFSQYRTSTNSEERASLVLRRIRAVLDLEHRGGGALTKRFGFITGEALDLSLEDVQVEYRLNETSRARASVIGLELGSAPGSDLGGHVRNLRVVASAGGAEVHGVRLGDPAWLQIRESLAIEDSDFSAVFAPGCDVLLNGHAEDKVLLGGNVWGRGPCLFP